MEYRGDSNIPYLRKSLWGFLRCQHQPCEVIVFEAKLLPSTRVEKNRNLEILPPLKGGHVCSRVNRFLGRKSQKFLLIPFRGWSWREGHDPFRGHTSASTV